MPQPAADDLSRETSRLSISKDQLDLKLQREQLLNDPGFARRDSAVSLSSGSTDESEPKKGKAKRRRSSVQSNGSTVRPKPKNQKLHKRALKKSMEQVSIDFKDDVGEYSMNTLRQLIQKIFIAPQLKTIFYTITKPEDVTKLVYCIVPGLTRDEFIDFPEDAKVSPVRDLKPESKDNFPFVHSTFAKGVASHSPGDKRGLFSALDTLTHLPITKATKRKLMEESKRSKITILDLRLTKQQMENYSFPIHSTMGGPQLQPHWVETESFEHDGSTIFALDCEFCQSGSSSVLTRISIVNFQGEVVLDSFVKPEMPITDYVTKYSGITEELLEGVETTHSDIQEKFKSIVSSTDILIGHSLESDLNVLRIRHPNIVDTSTIYEHTRGPPAKPSLRWLAEKYLERPIQQGESTGKGHSSIEDSTACLDLVKAKIQNGPLYGKNCDEMLVFDRIKPEREKLGLAPAKGLVIDHKGSECDTEVYKRIQVASDEEVVDNFTREVDSHDIIILSLRQLEADLGWGSSVLPTANKVEDSYKLLNERLLTIYSLLPENSVFVLTPPFGGDNKKLKELNQVRQNFRNIEKQNKDLSTIDPSEKWDFDKDISLMEEVKNLRKTVSFIKLKTSVH